MGNGAHRGRDDRARAAWCVAGSWSDRPGRTRDLLRLAVLVPAALVTTALVPLRPPGPAFAGVLVSCAAGLLLSGVYLMGSGPATSQAADGAGTDRPSSVEFRLPRASRTVRLPCWTYNLDTPRRSSPASTGGMANRARQGPYRSSEYRSPLEAEGQDRILPYWDPDGEPRRRRVPAHARGLEHCRRSFDHGY